MITTDQLAAAAPSCLLGQTLFNLIMHPFSFFISVISFYKGLLKISNARNMRAFAYSYRNTALSLELNRKYKTEFLTILALSNNFADVLLLGTER